MYNQLYKHTPRICNTCFLFATIILHESASMLFYTHVVQFCFTRFCGTELSSHLPSLVNVIILPTPQSFSFQMVYKLKLHTSVYRRYATWATYHNFFTCINNTINCLAEILPGWYLHVLFHDSCYNDGKLGGGLLLGLFERKTKCVSGFLFLGPREH